MTVQIPASKASITAIVTPHLASISQVHTEAWGRFADLRSDRPADMLGITASSRGMLVSDYTHEPAHRIFKGITGVKVEDRYGRPWLTLANGTVAVRFRKLSPDLALCRSDSGRATALAYHLPDPAIPGIPEATVLTAGYILDSHDIDIERQMLVCHFANELLYAIKLPGGIATAPPLTTQLPTSPLSEPMIRSARDTVAKRLAEGDTR